MDGFAGWSGGEAHLHRSVAWDSAHPLVLERPDLFRTELDVAADAWMAADPDPTGPSPAINRYDAMRLSDLRAELAARGLPTSGNKPDLAARLGAADTAAVTP
jgi:hypothetical protein